jgi:hypothetical protein
MRLPPSILRRVHRAQSGRLPLFPFLPASPKLGRQALSHVDEFQTFSSEALASLLSEERNSRAHFCLANQYTDQSFAGRPLAVLGNARTLVVFRSAAATPSFSRRNFVRWTPAASPTRSLLRCGSGAAFAATASSPS